MATILSRTFHIVQRHFELFVIFALFFLLLCRNPFSLRTQIPNFAPAPDAFYYVVPARSLIEGKGLLMTREGRSFEPVVPPLYSLSLAPIFLLKDDARMFYFVNVFLSFASLFVFGKILFVLFPKKRGLRFVLLFAYITNYLVYWYPTLAMAENLGLFLTLVGFLLLQVRITTKRTIIMGILAVSLYFTKYANVPLSAALFCLYALKVLLENKTRHAQVKRLGILFASASAAFFLLIGYETFYLHKDALGAFGSVFKALLPQAKTTAEGLPAAPRQGSWAFSFSNIPVTLPFYIQASLGKPIKILWEVRSLLSSWIIILGWAGTFISLRGKHAFTSLCILGLTFSEILFLLTFYSPDGRYLLHMIPLLLIGFGLLVVLLEKKLSLQLGRMVTLVIFVFLALISATRIKKDIMLNLKYTETPWWYIAITNLDASIAAEKPKLQVEHIEKKPIVISPMYPFLVDFYSNHTYTLLPLSAEQEFRGFKKVVWGDYDYTDMDALYTSFIKQGYPVYLASYGLGHEEILLTAFEHMQKSYRLKEVGSGCFDVCKIYRVYLLDVPVSKRM